MNLLPFLISILVSATSVTITEPVDGEVYDGDWLMLKAIVENEDELPDSVHYELNGSTPVPITRLNTDWPTYMQNYQNNGFSQSVAPVDNSVLWSAPVTSELHEFPTPVVVGGIAYYPSNYGTDSLYALDAATGELVWKYRVGPTDDAVTVQNGRVYTASDSIFCFDALSGALQWKSGLADGGGGTPIVLGGKVYCGVYNFLEYQAYYSRVSCLDAGTGEELWADTLWGYQASCMALWDNMLLVPTYLNGEHSPLYALEASTGDPIWENTDSYGGYWDSSPNVFDGMIYINGHDGYTRAIDAESGATVWSTQSSTGSVTATSAFAYGRIFHATQGTAGIYYCLEASNGDIVWTEPGTSQHGSSGIADGVVFYGEQNEFVQDSARVVARDCESGDEIWSYATSCGPYGGFQSSPSITDGVVYYACTDGYLYAFGTGLKYTYREPYFYADIGSNELIVTSYDDGLAAASDTISFTVTQQGFTVFPVNRLRLSVSPNPCSDLVRISFSLPGPSMTSVVIYDLAGRAVAVLNSAEMSEGSHELVWDGRGESGERVSAGLYLCRVRSAEMAATTGVCLLR